MIEGAKGNLCFEKKHIFEKTYEKVEDGELKEDDK